MGVTFQSGNQTFARDMNGDLGKFLTPSTSCFIWIAIRTIAATPAATLADVPEGGTKFKFSTATASEMEHWRCEYYAFFSPGIIRVCGICEIRIGDGIRRLISRNALRRSSGPHS